MPGYLQALQLLQGCAAPAISPIFDDQLPDRTMETYCLTFFDREKRKERRLDTAFLNKVSGWPPGLVRPPAARLLRGLRRRQPGRADAVLHDEFDGQLAAQSAVVSQLFCTPLLSSHPGLGLYGVPQCCPTSECVHAAQRHFSINSIWYLFQPRQLYIFCENCRCSNVHGRHPST